MMKYIQAHLFHKFNFFSDSVLKWLIVCAFLSAFTSAFSILQPLSYSAPVFFLFIIFSGIHFLSSSLPLRKVIISILVFSAWAFITSIWSVYPAYTMIRSLYFMIVTTGAVFSSYLWTNRLKKPVISFLLPLNIITIVLCILYIALNSSKPIWSGEEPFGFKGYIIHKNTLGALLLFTIPAVISQLITEYKNSSILRTFTLKKIFLLTALFLNFVFLFLSWSRASILCLAIACAFCLIYTYKSRFIPWALILITAAASIYILFPGLTGNIRTYLYRDQTSIMTNRSFIYDISFKAAKNGGLTGLGFGISDTSFKKIVFGKVNDSGMFLREKGNSFLAVVEETGIIGIVLLFIVLYYGYQPAFRHIDIRNASDGLPDKYILLIAFSFAFLLHSMFEAWLMSVRSIEPVIYFSFLGELSAHADRN